MKLKIVKKGTNKGKKPIGKAVSKKLIKVKIKKKQFRRSLGTRLT